MTTQSTSLHALQRAQLLAAQIQAARRRLFPTTCERHALPLVQGQCADCVLEQRTGKRFRSVQEIMRAEVGR